ncbi:hypothetical protein BJX70DRAFT_359165 [Aspergillus crustosus]
MRIPAVVCFFAFLSTSTATNFIFFSIRFGLEAVGSRHGWSYLPGPVTGSRGVGILCSCTTRHMSHLTLAGRRWLHRGVYASRAWSRIAPMCSLRGDHYHRRCTLFKCRPLLLLLP